MHNLADSLMSGANPIFDFIVVCLNFLSIFVIVWGVLIAGIDFVRYELTERIDWWQPERIILSAII